MSRITAQSLVSRGARSIFVANRSFDRAQQLATEMGGSAVRFDDWQSVLERVDVVISSTGCPLPIVHRADVEKARHARKYRPLFFIDIAVPRDIDPEINRLDNSYVYDVDDLKGIVEENLGDRQKEALKGERLIDEAVIQFRQWRESLDVVPTIVALRKRLEGIADAEIRRTVQGQGLSTTDAEALQRMMAAFINKALHEPTVYLKREGMGGDKPAQIDLVRKLFKLDE
jgi:glutamyl-tRNA reductase